MLLRFRVSNHRSIRTEQEFSFVSARLKDNPDAVVNVAPDVGAVRCSAIYGANASGKSNVLKAFAFMANAVENSQRIWAPGAEIARHPFELDAAVPSRFEADVVIGGVLYQYGFVVTKERFLEEWLYTYPNNRKVRIFHREKETFAFGKSFKGGRVNLTELTRPNSLFLSTAAQNNHEGLMPLYKWFADSTFVLSRGRTGLVARTAGWIEKNPQLREQIRQLVCAADLGVREVTVAQKQMEAHVREFARALMKAMKVKQADETAISDSDTLPEVSLHHFSGDREFVLDFVEESEGTQTYFALLGPLLSALSDGDTIFVDELDSSLHPLLCLRIVDLFNCSSSNPKGAQLAFTTHDTTLLSESSLRRDQIWFTEKDDAGATHLYPLTDFKPRTTENLQKGYLQGRYGGIPVLGNFKGALEERT